MPDRDFYYLIGLWIDSGEEQIECSFWADGLEDERRIWEDCLRTIKSIENAQLVHYGAYVRIPVQRCHLIQAKAATHSTAKLPPIPVKVATL